MEEEDGMETIGAAQEHALRLGGGRGVAAVDRHGGTRHGGRFGGRRRVRRQARVAMVVWWRSKNPKLDCLNA